METRNYLKSIRVRRNLKQDEAADFLGISRATYCDYENNPLKIDINTLYRMISQLNGNFDEFLSALKQDFKSYIEDGN